MIRQCYWKQVSLSESIEGETFRNQHPEIPFKKCRYFCSGYKDYGSCEFYVLREFDEEQSAMLEEKENLNVGRLEDIGI